MKKLMMVLVMAFAAAMPLMAETETVGDYTWSYRINRDGAAIEQYDGDWYKTAISPAPIDAVTIPSMLGGKPVTSIGASALSGCSGLTSVTIPNGVTNIGACAFTHCRSLTSVMIPDSVKSIGDCAFAGCSGLTSVTIPSSVTALGGEAFLGCSSLTSIDISESVTSFGASCFDGCPGYTLKLYRMVLGVSGGPSGSENSGGDAPRYALAASPADRAIASVMVDSDCAIDEFVLKNGKVYDSLLRIVNTADHDVRLTLPAGYVYETFKGSKPLTIPANSRSMLSITRTAEKTFLVSREELDDVK